MPPRFSVPRLFGTLDIAERGRSLGVSWFGAQQTASEVERRIIANAALKMVGRLDAAEAERNEYGFLSQVGRVRATLLRPGGCCGQRIRFRSGAVRRWRVARDGCGWGEGNVPRDLEAAVAWYRRARLADRA
jgi:DNA helicase HerA-like ATPase